MQFSRVACLAMILSALLEKDPSLPETERSKIILGAVGLLMGIFTAAAGVIYYKRKQTG
nr:novel protein similar to major histocompatibility complex class II DCB gene (mhc2dcb), MHC2DBC related sequence (mhc2dbc-rs) [Danio rerio]